MDPPNFFLKSFGGGPKFGEGPNGQRKGDFMAETAPAGGPAGKPRNARKCGRDHEIYEAVKARPRAGKTWTWNGLERQPGPKKGLPGNLKKATVDFRWKKGGPKWDVEAIGSQRGRGLGD